MRSAACRFHSVAAVLALTILSGTGCSSTSTSGDVLAADRPHPAHADKYPDFSQPLDSAMAQMSDEEAARMEGQLSMLARQRQAGRISDAEYRRRVAELRRLGQQTE